MFKLKIFLMCLNQVELNQVVRAKFKKSENFSKKNILVVFVLYFLAFIILFISTQLFVQSVVYTYPKFL